MKLPQGFKTAQIKARVYLQDSERAMKLISMVKTKADSSRSRITEHLDDLYTLIRLLTAYVTGEYREIPVKSMVIIAACLVYFLNPMDAIPDFIITIGFLDDLTVLAYVFKTLKDEIDRFIEWEMDGKDVENKS